LPDQHVVRIINPDADRVAGKAAIDEPASARTGLIRRNGDIRPRIRTDKIIAVRHDNFREVRRV
jgi:hypothetical protein